MIFRRTVYDPVYRSEFAFVICPWAEFKTWCQRHFDYTPPDKHAPRGFTLEHEHDDGAKAWVIWLPPERFSPTRRQLASMSHEALHLTVLILRDRGVQLSAESDEAFAYHHMFVFMEAMKAADAFVTRARRGKRRRRK